MIFFHSFKAGLSVGIVEKALHNHSFISSTYSTVYDFPLFQFTFCRNERHPLLTTEQPWVRVVTMVNATTNPFVGKPLTWRVQLSVLSLGLLVFISGVIGNVLIMMTLVSQKSLHSVHNIFIANLALADLVMSAYIMPFWLLDLVLGHHPVVNNVHCIVNAFFTHGAFNTALLTIVAISVHRYLCVCRNHLFVKVSEAADVVSAFSCDIYRNRKYCELLY